MDIYKLLRILSSESKARIITMYMNCDCHSHTVMDLCEKFNLNQANTSKHLADLREENILEFVKDGKEVYYRINPEFKKEHADLIKILASKDKTFATCTRQCPCSKK